MVRLLCTISIIIAFVGPAYSQQLVEKSPPPACDYTELYKKEGWVIPGINGAKKKGDRTAVPSKPETFMTELEPTARRATIQSFSCSREHAGRLEVKDLDVGIMDLRSFDIDGRIFAYNLVYGIDGIAAEWSVRFYDLDGSGHFSLRRSERNRFVPELIPDWVKDDQDAKAKYDTSSAVSKR
jgi:hypothetical protein